MSLLLPYLANMANVLYLISYLVRDILWLRIFAIIAGSSLIPYYYFQATPLWDVIIWNFVFISINLVLSVVLIMERRPVHLVGDELKLYRLVFDQLSQRDFKRLLELGEWKETQPESMVASNGKEIDQVIVIYEGELSVRRNDKELAQLSPGHFVGEMGYLTGKKASADVVALTPARYVSWSFESLRKYLPKHPELRAAFQNVLGADLVCKLRRDSC
ncbi:cyclic nucleotide-binding domain-containing protein [Rubellicoccus peritrichatus]|uniref:Cyclic nucleotide-binding domain-containing protein n=1 Tax=Rubellicoccus peritrichatus TaxID=3080537 RepID=A0AAQ3L977_9BACT|nr:cyclic nucleotide-binding domain-containing protein [Puniceicoccus sp. CR14]WOO41690.1 cyclic nucleotide-binding domain-containing protein [Puniceicoccus sp. CR14]